MANGIFNAIKVAGGFPVAPNPAAGTIYFGVDAVDGHFKIQTESGTVIDLQSGASYSDPDAVAAIQAAIDAATAELDPASADYLYLKDVSANAFKKVTKRALQKFDMDFLFQLASDFWGTISGEFTQYVSGTGASAQNGTYGQDAINNAIGVTQVDTGTTATGRAGLGTVTGAIWRPTLAKYKAAFRIALEAVSSVAETFVARIGMGDFFSVAGDGTNGLFFSYTDLVNGGRWLAVSRVAGVTVASVDTGVAPDLDYHVYNVELDQDGQNARFYIDGALVATISAPSLPAVGNPIGAGTKIEKTVGTGQRNMSHDWIALSAERSAVR
jgi:hypothetical protein